MQLSTSDWCILTIKVSELGRLFIRSAWLLQVLLLLDLLLEYYLSFFFFPSSKQYSTVSREVFYFCSDTSTSQRDMHIQVRGVWNIFSRMLVYQSARPAVTKYHRLGGLNNRNLSSHISGGLKSKTKVLTDLVSSEASLLGSQMAAFLLCVLTWPFLCVPVYSWCLFFFL